eukprot:TRINITY_DN7505_c0_g1_i1.p1 TRINITY_DN7505_c0_g1~~TRINITY_DN7505_c0_g1_i1.p1  ORF type:complete len:2029 (-),score=488.79 TRINITY_DN7505_c0_g1_i1:251-6337(-)
MTSFVKFKNDLESIMSGTCQDFEAVLNQNKMKFSLILEVPPPKQEERTHILNLKEAIVGRHKIQMSEELHKMIIMLSDQIQVGEKMCFELIVDASQINESTNLVESARILFRECRRALLRCINFLLSAQESPWLSAEQKYIIYNFVQSLFQEDYAGKMLMQLTKMIDLSNVRNEEERIGREEDRNSLIDNLYIIINKELLKLDSFKSLISLLQQYSDHLELQKSRLSAIASNNINYKSTAEADARRVESYFYTTSSIALIIAVAFKKLAERNGNANYKEIAQILDANWNSVGFHSIFKLIWLTYLHKFSKFYNVNQDAITSHFESAIENSVFETLNDVVLSFKKKIHCRETLYSSLVDLDELIYPLLESFLPLLKSLKQREEQQYRQQQQNGNARQLRYIQAPPLPTVVATNHFTNLLVLLKNLYKELPESSFKFWADQGFVRMAVEGLSSYKLHVPYLNFIASIAGGNSTNARKAYEFFASIPSKHLQWSQLFRAQRIIYDQYYQVQPQQFPQQQSWGVNTYGNNSSYPSTPMSPSPYSNTFSPASGSPYSSRYAGSNTSTPLRSSISNTPGGYTQQPIHATPNKISEDDQAFLSSVLKIVAQVAEYDGEVRKSLALNFDVLTIMIQLCMCPLQPKIKSHVLNVIRAFAVSPEYTDDIWRLLEESQMIPTLEEPLSNRPTPISVQQNKVAQGIKAELEEIETRNERYPYLRSYLQLIERLVRHKIPHDLGSNKRKPGITPYIIFVIEAFLTHDIRTYQDVTERWKIADPITSIFCSILKKYQPSLDERETPESQMDIIQPPILPSLSSINQPFFGLPPNALVQPVQQTKPGKSVGYIVTQLFLSNSPTLAKVVNIFIQARERLETDRYERNGIYFENTVLNCLNILRTVLSLENSFFEYNNFHWKDPVRLSSLRETLFYDTYSRSITSFASFLEYRDNMYIPITAVNILNELAATPETQKQIVGTLVAYKYQPHLVNAVCRILESGDPIISVGNESNIDKIHPSDAMENDDDHHRLQQTEHQIPTIENSLKIATLNLLISQLVHPFPNFTHLLLSFNLNQRASDPQIALERSSNHPLASILHVLNTPTFQLYQPDLALYMAKFIYKLCRDKPSSEAVIKYLRSPVYNRSASYFLLQLQMLSNFVSDNDRHTASSLEGRSWILKTCALEIFQNKSQKPYIKTLLDTLFTTTSGEMGDLTHHDDDGDTVLPADDHRIKILALLDMLDIAAQEPSVASFKSVYFQDIKEIVTQCTLKDPIFECRTINADLVNIELNSIGVEIQINPQTRVSNENIEREKERIIHDVRSFNTATQLYHSLTSFIKGWQEILMVSLESSYHLIDKKFESENVLYTLLESLLERMNAKYITRPKMVRDVLSSCVLIVIQKLRDQKCFQYNSVFSIDDTTHSTNLYALPIERLHGILNKLLEAITSATDSAVTRGNLYTSLLYYLKFTEKPSQQVIGETEGKSTLLVQIQQYDSQWSRLYSNNLSSLSAYGDKLYSMVATDTTGVTHPWLQSMSYSLLDTLISYDFQGKCFHVLMQTGYLTAFLDRLVDLDHELNQYLSSNKLTEAQSVRMIFESSLSFIKKIARSPKGAKYLLDHGMAEKLCACSFLDSPPDEMIDQGSDDWRSYKHYHNVLLSVLQILSSLLISLPKNVEAAAQVLNVLCHYREQVQSILRDRHPHITLYTISQLSELTAIFHSLTTIQNKHILNQMKTRLSSQYQLLILQLLHKYTNPKWHTRLKPITKEEIKRDRRSSTTTPTPSTTSTTYYMIGNKHITPFILDGYREVSRLLKHVIGFTRQITLYTPSEILNEFNITKISNTQLTQTVFIPTLLSDKSSSSSSSLGHLIQCMTYAMDCLNHSIIQKEKAIKDIKTTFSSTSGDSEGASSGAIGDYNMNTLSSPLSSEEDIQLNRYELSELRSKIETEIETYYYILENSVLIFYCHLNHFLGDSSITSTTNTTTTTTTTTFSLLSTPSDVDKLRVELNQHLNSNMKFWENICQIKWSGINLIEPIFSKIKKLIVEKSKK